MVPMKVSLVSIKRQMKLHLTQNLPWLTAFWARRLSSLGRSRPQPPIWRRQIQRMSFNARRFPAVGLERPTMRAAGRTRCASSWKTARSESRRSAQKMNVSDMDSSRYYCWSQIPFLAYCILLPIAYCILLPSASCILILNQFPILSMAYCILLLKSSPITTQWQSWPGPMTTHFLWFFLCKPIAVLPHAGRHRGHLGDWPRPVQPQQVPPVLWLLREELDDLGGLRGWEVGHQEALSLVGPNSW